MSVRKLALLVIAVLVSLAVAHAQKSGEPGAPLQLTIEKIMRDPKWIGVSPSAVRWSDDGRSIYFMWNPEKEDFDSLYVVPPEGGQPRKVSLEERKKLPAPFGRANRDKTRNVYEKHGDIYLLDIPGGRIQQITNTVERESAPRFTHDEKKVTFMRGDNLYLWRIDTGEVVQLTDFRKGEKKPEKPEPKTDQEKWLNQEELKLIQVLKERKEKEEQAKKRREEEEPTRPKEIYIQDKNVQALQLSPDERTITFRLARQPKDAKRTIVPHYVVESGFTEDIPARPKVGAPETTYEFGIYAIEQDKVTFVKTDDLPGIYDRPAYLEEMTVEAAGEQNEPQAKDGSGQGQAAKQEGQKEKKDAEKPRPRDVIIHGPYWSDDGQRAVVVVLSQDNKDRWIAALDVSAGTLTTLDRQRDEAWIGGPGISGRGGSGTLGWMPDNRRVWFQSEESGYSHLYTVDVTSGEKRPLTSGRYEIFDPHISRDKKYWYFTSNEAHPGERHFYRLPINGGEAVRITSMAGNNEVWLSPDEAMLAIRHSSSNRPWELFVMENRPGAPPRQITFSLSDEFRSYPWRDPEVVTFTARDGATVYARLYRPENPEPGGPAVLFVHGAGYLQNAHKWWSSYFREYMFHNFLADRGYTVLDIDYRGSAGYGRDWRTAISRHMGGKDLTDQVDGARFLAERYDVDPRRIGIYGGSYGGFITLMAMFTQPDVFAAGAALRPVTDWAHYNHPYTSNILNLPYLDGIAYERSSPIYHAEGLKGALLICHGMVDTNVHFQDVVRLAQRLIELGKENWEVAIYPVEDHGFREPSSWTDEYKRIFKLFEQNLNPD